MKNSIYMNQAINLSKAIDIAVDTIQKHPPKEFNESHIEHFINFYLKEKELILNPEPQYANIESLKYSIEDVFTYFNESNDKTVNIFWQKIQESKLPYKRKNRLNRILKKREIRNRIEYNCVVDLMVPYFQQGLLSDDDVKVLNTLINEFEQRS